MSKVSQRCKPVMAIFPNAVVLIAVVIIMECALGLVAPKTSINARRNGLLGTGVVGKGRQRTLKKLVSRRENDTRMVLGVSFFRLRKRI